MSYKVAKECRTSPRTMQSLWASSAPPDFLALIWELHLAKPPPLPPPKKLDDGAAANTIFKKLKW